MSLLLLFKGGLPKYTYESSSTNVLLSHVNEFIDSRDITHSSDAEFGTPLFSASSDYVTTGDTKELLSISGLTSADTDHSSGIKTSDDQVDTEVTTNQESKSNKNKTTENPSANKNKTKDSSSSTQNTSKESWGNSSGAGKIR